MQDMWRNVIYKRKIRANISSVIYNKKFKMSFYSQFLVFTARKFLYERIFQAAFISGFRKIFLIIQYQH